MKATRLAALAVLATIGATCGYATAQDTNKPDAKAFPAADLQFMLKAASGGLAEVELAKLAIEKATSPEVKKHAQHMIDDHTKANEELSSLATSKGVALPDQPDAKHQATIEKLRGLSGVEFDKTYIREAGVDAHTEMQSLFRDEVTNGQDAEVKAFAKKTLTVVEHHLDMSQKLSTASGGSAATGVKKSTEGRDDSSEARTKPGA